MGFVGGQNLFARSDPREGFDFAKGDPITLYSYISGNQITTVTMYTVPVGKKLILHHMYLQLWTVDGGVSSLQVQNESSEAVLILDYTATLNDNWVKYAAAIVPGGHTIKHVYNNGASGISCYTVLGMLIDNE